MTGDEAERASTAVQAVRRLMTEVCGSIAPPPNGLLATRSRHWKVRLGLSTVNRLRRLPKYALWVFAQQAEVRLMAARGPATTQASGWWTSAHLSDCCAPRSSARRMTAAGRPASPRVRGRRTAVVRRADGLGRRRRLYSASLTLVVDRLAALAGHFLSFGTGGFPVPQILSHPASPHVARVQAQPGVTFSRNNLLSPSVPWQAWLSTTCALWASSPSSSWCSRG